MTTDETPHVDEDFAQALDALKKHYGVNDSEVARRINVSPGTVNTWVHRKRQGRPDAIRAAREAIPISLGPRILRAETAALAALASYMAVAGDWR